MRRQVVSSIVAGAVMLAGLTTAAPFEELVPKFDRKKSNAMVRKVRTPTRACLDYAAYMANPVWYEAEKVKPKAPAAPVKLEEITFGGLLSDVRNTIDRTPLTDAEKAAPMAWEPLTKALWEVVKDPGFQSITGKINGHKWSDPGVYQAYQKIVAAWLHDEGGKPELWVRIEFRPWVAFLKGVATDVDGDAFGDLFGKLTLAEVPEEAQEKAFAWIREDYQAKVLGREEITDWITELASYWYPTKNTDILENEGVWPDARTEKKVIKTMKGVTVKNPIAVVRGRPSGDIKKPVYNVYVVESMKSGAAREEGESSEATAIVGKKLDTSVSKNFMENNKRFAAELKPYGSYDKWAESLVPFFAAQKTFLAGLPESQMGFRGKNDWVFFRKSLEYSTGGDLAEQARDKNPLPHLKDLKAYLEGNNVNLLFVVVPVKSEVYFEGLPFDAPADKSAIVNPYSRKVLKDVQMAGVEVIDLLPLFLKAKADDGKHDEALYQKQDTHWTNRGLQITANAVADRVKVYAWYAEAAKAGVQYTVVDTTFERQGDIVTKLPETEQVNFPAVTLKAQRVVRPDGVPYKSDKDGPVTLMGDSFTGVFELVDCKSAGIGSHVAQKTGLPVDILTSWGGGPLVRERLVRKRDAMLGAKRLVIYLMVARDLYNYKMGWADLPSAP